MWGRVMGKAEKDQGLQIPDFTKSAQKSHETSISTQRKTFHRPWASAEPCLVVQQGLEAKEQAGPLELNPGAPPGDRHVPTCKLSH